jgi:DnaK suppressor protein
MTVIAEPTELSEPQQAQLRARLVEDHTATEQLVARLVADLSAFTASRADSAADDEHDPEGPTLAFERSQAAAILGQTREHLAQIDSALVRIDAGAYGRCVTCGNNIPIARLDARPYSTECVICAGKKRS